MTFPRILLVLTDADVLEVSLTSERRLQARVEKEAYDEDGGDIDAAMAIIDEVQGAAIELLPL
jgi:hypothetical protein